MNSATRSSIQMFGAYCGLLYMIFLLLGWWLIAGFLPPTPPTLDAAGVANLFQDPTRIRIGMIIVMYCAMIFMPFAATLTRMVARIEGGAGTLTYTAVLGGAGNMILTFYPAIWWLVAAFRPERAPELIQLVNDMAWLQFIGGVSLYDALPLAVGIAILLDSSAKPVFPRWVGYFNIMVVVMILPDQLLFFFHSGPFAWTGIFGLWIPLALFGLWFTVMFFMMRAAILRERAES